MSDYEERFKRLHLVRSFKPVEGAEFELAVDLTPDPLNVIREIGQLRGDWKFSGPPSTGSRTFRAKLISLGDGANVEEARQRALRHGYRLVEGQAWKSFLKAFPLPAGHHVYFGGNEWQDSTGGKSNYIVILRPGIVPKNWETGLMWVGHPFTAQILWAVEPIDISDGTP